MKNANTGVCPGCKRHCPMNAVRCKYGKQHFAKLETAEEKKSRPRHKWERATRPGGLAWRLLAVSRSAKKALVGRDMTEDELLSRLSADDRALLGELLAKLDHKNVLAQATEVGS